MPRECCLTCKHYEDRREVDCPEEGYCDWFGEVNLDDNTHDIVCFDWEEKEEEEE